MPTEKERTDAAEKRMEDLSIGPEDTRVSPADGELALDETDSQVEPEGSQEALEALRAGAKPLPVEQMGPAIRQFFKQRAESRKLLRSLMVEGVHFGYPPGFKPKIDRDGNYLTYKKQKDGTWKEIKTSPKEYTKTESLYKAGAELICDIFGARPEYKPDGTGSSPACCSMLCRLFSKSGELLGEGHGACAIKKDKDYADIAANKAVKMAEKRALVNAVLDTYHLSDLFTQDLEDMVVKPYNAPAQAEGAPNVEPRDKAPPPPAVGRAEIMLCIKNWKQVQDPNGRLGDEGRKEFAKWLSLATGREFTAKTAFESANWTQEDLVRCNKVWEAIP